MVKVNEVTTKMLLGWEIKCTPEAEYWLDLAMKFHGGGFHPDTRGEDYVVFSTGKDVFGKVQAKKYNAQIDRVFSFIKDPYAYCLRKQCPMNKN